MKRDLEMTLPVDPQGGHIAFGIMLEVKSVDYEKAFPTIGSVVYRLKAVPYEMVQHIADDAMSVFGVPHVPVLDVGAGLHFTVERQHKIRRTSP